MNTTREGLHLLQDQTMHLLMDQLEETDPGIYLQPNSCLYVQHKKLSQIH